MRAETPDPQAKNIQHLALAALAARQHAVFTLTQAAAIALTPRAVRQRASCGRLHRIHQGVYSLVPASLLTRKGRYIAAVLACGSDAVLSHRSAADLLGLRPTERAAIEVTIAGRGPHNRDGIQVHRSATLSARDITVVDGIPCTTLARTLLDLAGVLRERQLERALDQAEATARLDLQALEDQIARNRRTPAAAKLRAALEDHTAGTTVTWSELEEQFLALCRAAGLPEPEVNQWVTPDPEEPSLRVDFLWRAQRLIVETDGHATHRTRGAFERDRERDQRLVRAGWRVIRITWRQLTEEPERVARLLADLLALPSAQAGLS